jgi:hypothetical protein
MKLSFVLAALVPGVLVACGGKVDLEAPVPLPQPSATFDPMTPVESIGGGCVPWHTAELEPFVLAAIATPAEIAAAMDGSWIGHAVAPQAWSPNRWDVALEIGGTSSSGGLYTVVASGGALPFHSGTTDTRCDPLRKWNVASVAHGEASGTIDVPFLYPDRCDLPGWTGELQAIQTDAQSRRIHMSFMSSDGIGPIVYSLWRKCPSH